MNTLIPVTSADALRTIVAWSKRSPQCKCQQPAERIAVPPSTADRSEP